MPDKIQEIFNYLMIEFPESSIGRQYDHRRKIETFILHQKGQKFFVSVSSGFLKDTSADKIETELKKFQLAEMIRQEKTHHILVTASGLRFEK